MTLPQDIVRETETRLRNTWDRVFRDTGRDARHASGALSDGYTTPVDDKGTREVPIYGNMGVNRETFEALENKLESEATWR